MKKIMKRAYAKINLSLDVLKKREDGYHDVCMIMHTIDLFDDVCIEAKDAEDGAKAHKISLSTNETKIPKDDGNIAVKAAGAVLAEYDKMKMQNSEHRYLHVIIDIEKRIPVSAGLAGGSSNAAAVLSGLNELLGDKIPPERLMEMAKNLGADVPFCMMGGCALAEGIGEKLTPLMPADMNLLLSKPDIEVSTAKVYKSLELAQIHDRPNTAQLVTALSAATQQSADPNPDKPKTAPPNPHDRPNTAQLVTALSAATQQSADPNPDKPKTAPPNPHERTETAPHKRSETAPPRQTIYADMKNVLETVTLRDYPQVANTKDLMKETGAEHVLMSGSGPTVFGIYTDKDSLMAAYDKMKTINDETFITKTVRTIKDKTADDISPLQENR